MMYKRYRMCVSAFVLLSVSVLANAMEEFPFEGRSRDRRIVWVTVSGSVEDSSGTRLSDVKCDIKRFLPSGVEGGTAPIRRIVNGEFAFRCQTIAALELTFYKRDYELFTLELDLSRGDDSSSTPLPEMSFFRRIVLSPERSKEDRIVRLSGLLGAVSQQSYHVMRLDKLKPEMDFNVSVTTDVALIHDPQTTDMLAITAPALALDFVSDISVLGKTTMNYETTVVLSPAGVRPRLLVLNCPPGDGLQAFEPQVIPKLATEFPSSMRTAPEGGYNSVLLLPAEFVDKPRIYFFGKSSGYYFKGVLLSPGYVDGIGVSSSVELAVQSNGSRDLTTPITTGR